MNNKTWRVIEVIGAIVIVGIWVISVSYLFDRATHQPNIPPKPAEATIKITEADGDVYWTKAINFNETRSCVIFVALPAGTHSVVCGNYRMEGLQSEHIQAQ